jgi:hypothetical protein
MPKKKTNENYRFLSKHFYELLQKQEYRCVYSGRELTPTNTHAVHRIPLSQGGKHELKNIVLIDRDIYYLKKQLTPDQLFYLAVDIIKTIGKENGYKLHIPAKVATLSGLILPLLTFQ